MNWINRFHNWLITIVVGKKPVVMNITVRLAHGEQELSGTILINNRTKLIAS